MKKNNKHYKELRLKNKEQKSQVQTPEVDLDKEVIAGRNAILEAIKSGREINKILFQEAIEKGRLKSIFAIANEKKIICQEVPKRKLDNSTTERHQGVIAYVAPYSYYELDEVVNNLEINKDTTLLILDHIEDPHNLGAIIRTANQAGAHGVIIPKRHAVGLTATVARTSAGAINYTHVAKVTNISRTIEELKEKGIWFACADMSGELMYNCNLTGAIGLVIGSEGNGVSRLVKEKCDFVVKIPMFGQIDSLNASVAAGVLSYEIVRQRMNTK